MSSHPVICSVLLVDDPQPVFEWLGQGPGESVVRMRADSTVLGWVFRVAFSDAEAAQRFTTRWRADLHEVQYASRRDALFPRAARGVSEDARPAF